MIMILKPSEPPDVSEVEAGFLQLCDRYRSLKRTCEEQVVTWRWASNDLYDPRPLYFEMHGHKKGRLLKQVPKTPDHKPEYGYDSAGIVHLARKHVRFSGYPDRLWFYETFYLRGGDEIEVAHFNYHPDKEPIFYAKGNYDDEGRLRFWRSRARGGLTREAYIWDEDKILQIEVEYVRAGNDGTLGALLPYTRYEIHYAEDGTMERVLCHWCRRPDHPSESTQIVYERRPASVTLEQMVTTLRSILKDAIVDLIRRAWISAPVYSLVLAWGPGQQGSLPPSIGLGLDSERQDWLQTDGKEAKEYLWNPAEYQNFLEIRTESVEQACRALNQECQLKDSWKLANQMLNELARELNAIDWTGILQTTDDFVAYAVDFELTHLRDNLKYSAGPMLVKMFEQRCWL